MIEFEQTIQDPLGLHARPVALLFDCIGRHHSRVTVAIGDRSCDGRDIMGLMGLYGTFGETVHFTVEGDDEAACAADVRSLISTMEAEL